MHIFYACFILLFNCECLTGILVILKKFCFMCYKLSFMSFYVLWNIVNSSSTVLIMDILCAKSFNIINLQLIYGKYDLFIRILFQRTFFWCSSFHSAKYKFLLILIYSLTYSYSKIIYFTSIFSWQIDTANFSHDRLSFPLPKNWWISWFYLVKDKKVFNWQIAAQTDWQFS